MARSKIGSSSSSTNKSSHSHFAIVAVVALLVYANTLVGDFTFDDNFAVITNGDVTSDANPISGLFKHDFWGQDIASPQSHKSYRPITVLAFRLTRQAWSLVTRLAPGVEALIPAVAPVLRQQQQEQEQTQAAVHDKPTRPPGLHPFPFHLLSVVLHAAVSMMVLALAQHFFAKLEQATGGTAAESTESSAVAGATAAASGEKNGSGPGAVCLQRWLMLSQQPALWVQPVSQQRQLQALLAALLFALHPVHTEAVAGVVGCAELLCALWSLPALLLYFMAVDSRYAAAMRLQHCQSSSMNGSTSSSNDSRASRARLAPPRHKPPATSTPGEPPGLQLQHADFLQHWLLVLAAAGLSLLAALSKEIGITIVGTMALYDVLLAPHMLPALQQHHQGRQQLNTIRGSQGSVHQHLARVLCRRQILRIAMLATTTVLYVKLRQWVAVRQLVAIYRKVENPIPFASSRLTRVLTTGYLHARYFGLLLLPVHLSADWSFSCIPLVNQLADPRNVATLALYAYFFYVGLSARPCHLCLQLLAVARHAIMPPAAPEPPTALLKASATAECAKAEGQHTTAADAVDASALVSHVGKARWRLLVVVGLLIASFFPASNVLFYVGTFIGERLLYFPSIGFCLLLSDLLGSIWPSSPPPPSPKDTEDTAQQSGWCQDQHRQRSDKASSPATSQTAALDQHARDDSGKSTPASRVLVLMLLLLVVAPLLLCYAARTLVRNVEWWDEERLFLAALRVCPNSAKVQQNCGVLQRRYQNFEAALQHFRRAQEIEPGYCEPSYWIALTRINQADVLGGLAAMKDSLSCKYTASEALQTLNKLYLLMHHNTPDDPAPLLEWGGVLAAPTVLRVADACATVEDAAMLAVSTGRSKNYVNQSIEICMDAIKHWEQGSAQRDTLAGLALDRFGSSLNTTLLRRCVGLRRQVYRRLTGRDLKSPAAKDVLYKYIAKVQSKYPGCRTLLGGGSAPQDVPEAGRTPSSHQKLLHRAQAADPEDPWLQLEWGSTLLALGPDDTLREAAMHLEVSSAIFSHIQQQLLPEQQQAGGTSSQPAVKSVKQKKGSFKVVTALDRSPLTPEGALEAAMLPLERFRAAAANSARQDVQATYCELLKRLCHLRLQMVLLVQQAATAADAAGSSAGAAGSVTSGLRDVSTMKVVLNAKAAGRRCLVELYERRGCEQQAADIRRMVGRDQDNA